MTQINGIDINLRFDLAQNNILFQIKEKLQNKPFSIDLLKEICKEINNKPFKIMIKDLKELNKTFNLNLTNEQIKEVLK